MVVAYSVMSRYWSDDSGGRGRGSAVVSSACEWGAGDGTLYLWGWGWVSGKEGGDGC